MLHTVPPHNEQRAAIDENKTSSPILSPSAPRAHVIRIAQSQSQCAEAPELRATGLPSMPSQPLIRPLALLRFTKSFLNWNHWLVPLVPGNLWLLRRAQRILLI